jgi:hypothetical protein
MDLLSARRADAGDQREEIVMSDSASRLPPRPSLEQLRKQAKELSASDNVQLAEAQHRLARQYGFESWPKLVQHVESLQPLTLAQFERIAADVLAAFQRGDATARQRVEALYNIRILSPQTLRARLKDHLGVTAASPVNAAITTADARTFVARAHGFESWRELELHMAPKADRSARDAALPYSIDAQANRISPRHALTRADWDLVIAVMQEQGITGLDAGGQMTDAVLERVARLDHVTHLGLGGSDKLTDDGLVQIATMSQLEHLNVGGWHSPITDRGLAVLRHLRSLREFHAGWSQRISDAGVANLRLSDRLESVDLMGTPTGDGTLAALTGKPSLRVMKTGALVSDAGLSRLKEFPAFATKTWQSGESKLGLMSYSDGPNHLMLDGPFSDQGLARLTADGLAGLFGLNLFWHVKKLSSDALAAIARLEQLELLGCKGELCDDRGMRHIAAIPQLRMLMAQGAVARDDGFVALSKSRSIEYVWGRECENLRGRGFAALADMPALRGLGVSCKKVDDKSLAALSRFPALEQLMPMDVTDDGFRHVGRCEKLINLWCMYCRETGDVATRHLAALTRLRSYYAGNTKITDASLEMLGRLPSLESIELWEVARITDAGVAHLATLPRLREVGISGSPKVTRKGMDVFPASVKASYST